MPALKLNGIIPKLTFKKYLNIANKTKIESCFRPLKFGLHPVMLFSTRTFFMVMAETPTDTSTVRYKCKFLNKKKLTVIPFTMC